MTMITLSRGRRAMLATLAATSLVVLGASVVLPEAARVEDELTIEEVEKERASYEQELLPKATIADGGIRVEWNTIMRACSYVVQKRKVGGGASVTPTVTRVKEAVFVDRDVAAGQTYAYQILAKDCQDRVMEGVFSRVAGATFEATPDGKPATTPAAR